MDLTTYRIQDGNLKVQDNVSGQCSIYSVKDSCFIFESPEIPREQALRAIKIFNSIQLEW